MSTVARGVVGECLGNARLLDQGFSVCVPIDPSLPFDALVVGDLGVAKIQYKVGYRCFQGGRYCDMVVVTRGSGKGKKPRKYKEGDFDFAIVIFPEHFFVIPFERVTAGCSTLNFSTQKDLWEYEEGWDLIAQRTGTLDNGA